MKATRRLAAGMAIILTQSAFAEAQPDRWHLVHKDNDGGREFIDTATFQQGFGVVVFWYRATFPDAGKRGWDEIKLRLRIGCQDRMYTMIDSVSLLKGTIIPQGRSTSPAAPIEPESRIERLHKILCR